MQHWLGVYAATNDVEEQPRGGRPRATSARDDKKLVQYAEAHEGASTEDVTQSLKRRHVEVSTRTVRRRLEEAGLEPLMPLFKPQPRKARQEWAQTNKARNWHRVMFSDETTFELFRKAGRLWRRRGKPVVQGTVKHPFKLQVWGCFSAKGFVRISCFSGTLNAAKMCRIYSKALIPSAREAYGARERWILQEDNDPKHRSRRAQAWRSANNVDRMD